LVPDFALFDSSGQLVAIMETKGFARLLGEPLSQAISLAKALKARFALVTNGHQVLIYDSRTDMTLTRQDLPSPEDIGLEVEALDVKQSDLEGPVSVVPIITESEIVPHLREFETRTLILDHTLPWGTKPVDFATALFDLSTSEPAINSVIGICTPNLCFSPSHRDFRTRVRSSFEIAAIVELPPDLLKPYAQIKTSLLALTRVRDSAKQKTFFLAISSRDELLDPKSRPWFTNFKNGISGRDTTTGFHSWIASADPWTVGAHDPGQKRLQAELAKYPTIRLGEACDIFLGFKHSREETSKGKGIPVIRGRDISKGVDSKEDLTHYRATVTPPEHAKIRPGDLLLQRIGSSPSNMVATPALSETIASDTVIIIRPKGGSLSAHDISQFFSSTVGKQVLSSVTAGEYAPTLSLGTLRDIQVPQLPRELYEGLNELSDIESALRVRADKLRSMRLDLFGMESNTTPEQRLRQLRQTAKAISASIQQAEALDFQIRNLYPYPVAFSYRSLSANTVPSELYRDQLRLAENILAYVASVSLALISPQDRKSSGLDLKQYWQRGISPGHWREIAQKCSRLFSEYRANRLAQALHDLWNDRKKRSFQDRVDELIAAKNDFKHDRGPKTEDDFKVATGKVQNSLQDCMRELGFFAEHPLRLVRDMSGIRGRPEVSLVTLLCMGDHPGFVQQQTTYPSPVIKNDLYMEVVEDNWIALHPFVVPYDCPQCKNREFYFIDRWPGDGKPAILKSFERGHTQESNEVSKALSNWATN
jgi:hypothetical protein